MDRRLKLQKILETILGSRNVYYQPPDNIHMNYPAIKYHKNIKDVSHADDIKYKMCDSYTITVIDKNPDNQVIYEILKLPYSSYDRNYISNNLEHDVITLYY